MRGASTAGACLTGPQERRSPVRSVFPVALLAAGVLAAGLAAPAPARADEYNWMSPEEVQEAMEKHHAAGIFVFEVQGEPAAGSYAWEFKQGDSVQAVNKFKFACC